MTTETATLDDVTTTTDTTPAPRLDWNKSQAGAVHTAETPAGVYRAERCPKAGRFYLTFAEYERDNDGKSHRIGGGATLAKIKQRAEKHNDERNPRPVPTVYPCCDDPDCRICHGSGVYDPTDGRPVTVVNVGGAPIPFPSEAMEDTDLDTPDPAPVTPGTTVANDRDANDLFWVLSGAASPEEAGRVYGRLGKGGARRLRKTLRETGFAMLAGVKRIAA